MPQGFSASTDETKIAIVVKRLSPAASRHDGPAFALGLGELKQRYGGQIVAEGLRRLGQTNPWVTSQMISYLSKDKQQMIEDGAYDIIAETLEAAGLRLEDHLRVSDKGVAVTVEAVAVIAATGFPGIAEFGQGNATLDGMGLNRNPFIHELAEFNPANERMNFWAAVSVLISGAQGWVPGGSPSNVAIDDLKAMVTAVSPTVDFDLLLHRARYDDRVLLRLASLAHRGLEM